MIIVTINLDNLMMYLYDMKGPLVTFYPDFTHRVFNEIWFFLTLTINFLGLDQTILAKFFYLTVNEFIYFIISMILISFYSKFKNLTFYIIILLYIIGLTLKSYFLSVSRIENLIEFSILIWSFEFAFTLYINGVILGIFY